MAAMLYMPRLFAYHSGSIPGGELEVKMIEAEAKLNKIIMTPAMLAAFIFGVILIGYNWPMPLWLIGKLILVLGMIGFHGYLSKTRKLFAAGQRPKSEKFFRMINEIPAIVIILIVILAIVRPF